MRSNINNRKPDTNTGNDNKPIIAVTRNAQMVKGIRHKLIPLVRKLRTVVM